MKYDKIIIGAGLYGLYAAESCGRNGEHILLLEKDSEAFSRATYINQARVHMGYHYPRSYSTAIRSAQYFNRFVEDYGFCLLEDFDQVYAVSTNYSWTNAAQFQKFCKNANIDCTEIDPARYFKKNLCDGAFLTKEYSYDAHILRDHFLKKLAVMRNVEQRYNSCVTAIKQDSSSYRVFSRDTSDTAPFVLNATYASTNQIAKMAGLQSFDIKYELCEIILCDVVDSLKNTGLTVMDGPFFSIMPFGRTGKHSLTAVDFTPHMTSYDTMPTFPCQGRCADNFCTPNQLGNCNDCAEKPNSAWKYMYGLAKKYMRDELGFSYQKSLFSMKPILRASEVDDSRPTVIRVLSKDPTFVCVLSGKINTVYDLDEVIGK